MENIITQNINISKPRDISIDRFRGIAMFCLLVSVILSRFTAFSPLRFLFEHNIANGGLEIIKNVALADMFMACFIFIIGLTMVNNFNSYQARFGRAKAYYKLALRGLGLMGIGTIVDCMSTTLNVVTDGKAWADVSTLDKTCVAFFAIVLLAFVVNIIAKIVKKPTFSIVASKIFRYSIALIGIWTVYNGIADIGAILANVPSARMWDVLQAIGFAQLVALPFVDFNKYGRLLIACLLLVCMTIFYQYGGFTLGSNIVEGGVIGGIGWGSIVLIGSVCADFKQTRSYWILTASATIISILAITVFGIVASKRGCTPAYALFTSSIAAIIWGLLRLLNNFTPKFAPFTWYGRNSIVIYISALILGELLSMIFGQQAISIWIALATLVALITIFTTLVWGLNRKKIFIRL